MSSIYPQVYPPYPQTPASKDAGQRRDIELLKRRAQTPDDLGAWAYIRTNSARTITANNTQAYQSLHDAVDAAFETNASTVFENASTTAITGSALWGFKMLANGTYRIEWNFYWTGGTTGVVATGYHTTSGGNTISFWQGGRTAGKINDGWDQGSGSLHTTFDELTDATVTNPAPIYAVPWVQVVSGSDPTVRIEGIATYLGPFAGTAL